MVTSIPKSMKALVCEAKGQDLTLSTVPVPEPVPGSVLVKILCSVCNHHIAGIIKGHTPFEFPTPFIPGGAAVGRIAAVGSDTTSLTVGQLVLLDSFIRARDNPNVQILWGTFGGTTPTSQKFMKNNWSSGTFAEYALAPLENTTALDESRLCGSPSAGGLGYAVEDLQSLAIQAVAYGGLRSIGVQAGETVIVAPATGIFSGSAVGVADAMGAKVIAAGRNRAVLEKLKKTYPRIQNVQHKGEVSADAEAMRKWGAADAYVDISPAQASASTHVRSCFMALKQYARVSLMGVIKSDLAMPYHMAVWNSLTIKGQYLFDRKDVAALIKMAETGILKLGAAGGWEITGKFSLGEIEKGIEIAASQTAAGQLTLVIP